jgi:S1-C subfamily serine protease
VIARRAAMIAGLLAAVAAALAGCGEAASPAVLQVTVRAPSGGAEAATAFATGDGHALTVAHAVAGARAVWVAEPGSRASRARVARTDERLDLALLAVPGLKADALRVATPRAGQRARVIVMRGGRSRSLRATVHRLITARVRDAPGATARVRPALELDAAVMQGDSGAPVLDAEGRVIGVVFAQASQRDDRAYALDARALPSAG